MSFNLYKLTHRHFGLLSINVLTFDQRILILTRPLNCVNRHAEKRNYIVNVNILKRVNKHAEKDICILAVLTLGGISGKSAFRSHRKFNAFKF